MRKKKATDILNRRKRRKPLNLLFSTLCLTGWISPLLYTKSSKLEWFDDLTVLCLKICFFELSFFFWLLLNQCHKTSSPRKCGRVELCRSNTRSHHFLTTNDVIRRLISLIFPNIEISRTNTDVWKWHDRTENACTVNTSRCPIQSLRKLF